MTLSFSLENRNLRYHVNIIGQSIYREKGQIKEMPASRDFFHELVRAMLFSHFDFNLEGVAMSHDRYF